MSMLSAQCDKLRAMAESVGLAVPQAATLMMEAADTITELRGALQVASADYRHLQAERDKLREERREYQATIDSLVDECTDHKSENAKLRELAKDMLKTIQVMDDEWHSLTDFTTMAEAAETYDFDAENAPEYEEKLRELGVDA